MVATKYYFRLFLSVCVVPFLLTSVEAAGYESIQLVGSFGGITCEPDDPDNNMDPAGVHLWQKLKYISEPGDPDSISFKFTADNSYLPMHWGYDLVADYGYSGWGFADYTWSPPNIIAILEESGYYFFHFNDLTYEYWLSRPNAGIQVFVDSEAASGVPPGLVLTLLDSEYAPLCSADTFTDNSFLFEHLPEGIFSVLASAPGYSDTTFTDIPTIDGEIVEITLTLTSQVGISFSSAEAKHVDGGIMVTWITSSFSGLTGFNIFRGTTPDLSLMERRNASPVFSLTEYRYFDICDVKEIDYYYYIVEATGDDPSSHGPIKVSALLLPSLSALGQNYPNPFNPATTIPFYVAGGSSGKSVMISFFDVSGRIVEKHDLGVQPSGNHRFEWNPSLSGGRNIPSGVYYCRLEIGKDTFTRKMIMLR
ncbi:MAG: T9SS type A sorting domain-containing protein [Candidatus Krumholzibacteriota bacterium]|nr:T9SS type A sorting domain-containing protein [Candidatus Krumholzibacteriota bacterium]